MKPLFIAFTNAAKLNELQYKDKQQKLNEFFETKELGFLDAEFLFLIITDNAYELVNEIPSDITVVVSIICYDYPEKKGNEAYVKKVEALFKQIKENGRKVVVVHHTNQNEALLTLIKNSGCILRPSTHTSNSIEYKAVIDIITQLRNEESGNAQIVANCVKRFQINDKLEKDLDELEELKNTTTNKNWFNNLTQKRNDKLLENKIFPTNC